MKKIIVPIDFSEHSEYALKTAAKLAKKHDAQLLALHMLEMSDIMLSASDGLQNQKAVFFLQLAEKKFNDFLQKDYLEDVKVTPIIKHFKVFSEVNDAALKNNADLIVMGSHGTSGLKELFVGSNTERVVRNADIPVLVVKNNVMNVNFDVVTFACDFSEENVKSYLKAVNLFEKMNSKVYMVYVNLPNDKFKSSLEIEKRVVNFFTKADGNLKIQNTQFDIQSTKVTLKNKIDAINQELESFILQNSYTTTIVEDYNNMLSAEERKFFLGESSLFLVNSRESKLIDAKLKAISLENDFFKTKASLFNVLAISIL